MGRGQWGGGNGKGETGEMGETEVGRWGGGGEGGEELARARSGKEKGRQEGGQEGVGWGEGRQDWDNSEETGRGAAGRGRWRGGKGKGETGGGQREWGEEGERGGGILQMDMIQAHGMPEWNEVTVFSD